MKFFPELGPVVHAPGPNGAHQAGTSKIADGWPGQSEKKLGTVPWEKREGTRAEW